MRSLSKTKEVQSLSERVAALNRFISKATDKCFPSFESLKGNKKFLWMKNVNKHSKRLRSIWANPRCLRNQWRANRSFFI